MSQVSAATSLQRGRGVDRRAGGRLWARGGLGGGSGQDSMEVAVASSSRALSCLAQEHSHAAQAIDVVVIGVGA